MSRRRGTAAAALTAALALTACGDDGTTAAAAPSAPASPQAVAAASAGPSWSSARLVLPLDTATPAWQPGPPQERPGLATWVSKDDSRAIRFLVPVEVYPPGTTTASPAPRPAEYVAYLRKQAEYGGRLTDERELTVGGEQAVEVTATSDRSLDGSLGCPEEGLAARDCFGLQPEYTLRLAVVPHGGRTLLAWLRTGPSMPQDERSREVAAFDSMLASIRFSDRAVSSAAAAARTPLEGTWLGAVTHAELSASPLLLDPDEDNDGNWGDLALTFAGGSAVLNVRNAVVGSEDTRYAATVKGDVLTLAATNGDVLTMRWRIAGDRLVLTRDKALGVGPTTFVLKPFARRR